MAVPATQIPQKPQPPPPPPSRMTLTALVKGKQPHPIRALLYGVEGVGKSTFAADAPTPIFLGAEDGTAELDIARFPTPESWSEVLGAVQTLTAEAHNFGTLVVDTLDWVEPLIWAHICKRDVKENIEDYGYGKGYVAALDEWRLFFAAMERLRRVKPMHVLLLAHSWIKPFKNPTGDDFDRYELKLHAKAGGLAKEWTDCVLFAEHETLVAKNDKTKRVRGVSTGARIIHTTRTAAWDAKNRYSLPEKLPLDWSDFFAAVQAAKPADPAALAAAILENAHRLNGEIEKTAKAWVEKYAGNAAELARMNDRVNAKLAEQGEV